MPAALALGVVSAPPRRFPTLHALRGLAAWSVVVLHAGWVWHAKLSRFPFVLGYWGVDVFFLLSGFLMVHVTRGWRGVGAAARFLWARAERTVPPYWASLCVAAALYSTIPLDPRLDMPPITGALLARNMLTLDQHLLPVSWSLQCEWVFYGVFAVVCVLAGVRARWLALGWGTAIVWWWAVDGPFRPEMLWLLGGALAGDLLPPDPARDTRRYPSWLTLSADYSYALYLLHVPALFALQYAYSGR